MGVQQIEALNLPAYGINTLEWNELNLRSGQVVNTNTSPIIIEKTKGEFSTSELELVYPYGEVGGNPTHIVVEQKPPTKTIVTWGGHIGPPYPGQFSLSKHIPQP